MYFENKFDCSACGYDFEREDTLDDCKRCHESFCEECLDDGNNCSPCVE